MLRRIAPLLGSAPLIRSELSEETALSKRFLPARSTFAYAALAAAGVLAGAASPGAAAARPACPVADSFRQFQSLADATAGQPDAERLKAFRQDYFDRRRDLYRPDVVALPSGPGFDARVLAELKTAHGSARWLETDETVREAVPRIAEQFAEAFPGFRCDFTVYVTASFGALDGAGRIVDGRPALVLGVDTIAGYETPSQLPVFLTHELFHRYHFQAAGFSDDLAERDLLWRSLWAEGLATYVSAALNPHNPLSDALMLPRDLEARARPLVPAIAAELAASLDRVDAPTFFKFFGYGDRGAEQAGWPSRSGYYLGYLVARDLARTHSLAELAHMKGPALRAEIGEALSRLARPAPPAAG